MAILILFALLVAPCAAAEPVRFSQGKIEVPTYTYGRGETVAPLFKSLENMGHYPYTILDWNSRVQRPVPVQYASLVLENEYLRTEFLPELGGRIYSAYDKVAQRQLFYHPTVIKPGRYNPRGAWPVGNLELYGPYDVHMITWPGEPWAWALQNHPDGSATLVLSHVDHFFRDKISLAVTMYPGKAFLETTIRLQNKNLLPNRYLIWTNAGVAVTEGSRFVYPMTQTIGHDSSALNTWPIIGGVDMSWNKNNVNMLGVFGLDIFDNFMSIYDYKTDYGTICYTNRLLARGMKTWTFGSGQTAWRQAESYTDNDGIYMEMQSGRFIWDGNYEMIDPGKTDGWTEYWFGAGKLGGLSTASRDAAVFLDIPEKRPATARLSVTATGDFPKAKLELIADENPIWSVTADLEIGAVFRSPLPLSSDTQGKILRFQIHTSDGQLLLVHEIRPDGIHPNAVYAKDSIPRKFGPLDTLQVEELYQKGVGNEKFGQIADAEEAYRVALSKDPMFSPVHLRLGLLAMERLEYPEALSHFEKVLERDPSNGDAHYFLGMIYSDTGKRLEAERHFYRLLPSAAKFERRSYMLALLALKDQNWREASAKLSHAVAATPLDLSVRQAYAYLLRKTGRFVEAEKERRAILVLDPTNAFVQSEQLLAEKPTAIPRSSERDDSAGLLLDRACANHPQAYLELATEYFRLSAWAEAAAVLDRGIAAGRASSGFPDPLLLFYRAYVAGQGRDDTVSQACLAEVRGQDMNLEIFPFRSEDARVLQYALNADPGNANAADLLADLLYSRNRGAEAVALWRRALESDAKHFLALRDLGLALLAGGERKEGLETLTRASMVRPDHLATTMLLTNINARLGNAAAARQTLERAMDKGPGKDALFEKLASVEAQLGNTARALQLLTSHTFEATHQIYSLLHLYRAVRMTAALEAYEKGSLKEALGHVRSAARPPTSLGIDDFATVSSARLLTFEALLHQAAGQSREAQAAWQAAASARDTEYEGEGLFRAIALQKIGKPQQAGEWLSSFPVVNEQRKTDSSTDLRIQAHYLGGIYAAFKGDDAEAGASLRRSLEIDQSFLYARQALAWLDAGLLKGLRQ
jgi:tetratricopeptide (TPR) repeat protein